MDCTYYRGYRISMPPDGEDVVACNDFDEVIFTASTEPDIEELIDSSLSEL